MLRYVLEQDELVASFVAAMIPECRERGFSKCRAIGVVNADNELIAGIVYHSYSPPEEDNAGGVIEMSAAALPGCRWLTRTTLKVMYEFPFLQCGCQMVVMRTRADNEHILRQLAAFNYMLIKIPRLYGRNADGVVCLLTDDDWRANRFQRRSTAQLEEAA